MLAHQDVGKRQKTDHADNVVGLNAKLHPAPSTTNRATWWGCQALDRREARDPGVMGPPMPPP